MSKPPEFLVDRIDEHGLVCGQNLIENDIPIGTVFTQIVTGDDVVSNVRLELRGVQFYHHQISVIPGGHSAGLELTGEGLLTLRDTVQGSKNHVLLKA